MNDLTSPLNLVSQPANPDDLCNFEAKPKVNLRPSTNTIRQWEVQAQANLVYHQQTGELPKEMFVFD